MVYDYLFESEFIIVLVNVYLKLELFRYVIVLVLYFRLVV